ncbi:MAG: hypothetical protein J6Y02_19110 [Pseudobutyrivibrio sp.]|nr:hypothetical protein [Pseudobutyrivibrio sp.]
MLTITVPAQEIFNEKTGHFFNTKECTLKLEHSLLSLTKWEGKHHKYFLGNEELTPEEIIDYIRCMTINQVDENTYYYLTQKNIEDIKDYIKDPMTATWFDDPKKEDGDSQKAVFKKKDIVTSEVIYSSMFLNNIPLEFEKRHLNHLITLIRVINEKTKTDDGKKMNPRDLAMHNSALNKARKAKLGIKG